MSIQTTEIQTSGGGTPKVLQPGNHTVKINSITFDKTPFKEESWNINLHMEGEPLGDDFEGFLIDKNDPDKGSYKGQVARVRASTFPFKDAKVGNTMITRDQEILKFLKNFCDNLGITDWLESQNERHDTIENLMEQLEKDKPYQNKWVNVCLAGKTYMNKENFLNYDLYLPYFSAKATPIELKGTSPSRLIKYNSETHIYKGKEKKKATGAEFEL